MISVVVLLCQVSVYYALLALLEVVLWHSDHTLVKQVVHHFNASLLLYHSVEVLFAGHLYEKQYLLGYQLAVNVHLVLFDLILSGSYLEVRYFFEDFIEFVLEAVIHFHCQLFLVQLF